MGVFAHSIGKDNTGYDLKQLFIGSEGTLGIVTKIVMKLDVHPAKPQVAFLGISDIGQIPKVLKNCYKAHLKLQAFEFLSAACLELVLKTFPTKKNPLQTPCPHYLIIEFDAVTDEESEKFFETCFAEGVVVDGTISTNSTEYAEIWSLREFIPESISTHKLIHKNDIAVPVMDLTAFLEKFEAITSEVESGMTSFTFGHIGDGNAHLNLASNTMMEENFRKTTRAIQDKVVALLLEHGGSISAEHGIGLVKKELFVHMLPNINVEVMKKIKSALDPKGILNPGKIFDNEIADRA